MEYIGLTSPKAWNWNIEKPPWTKAAINILTPRCLLLYKTGRKWEFNLANGPITKITWSMIIANDPKALIISVSILVSELKIKVIVANKIIYSNIHPTIILS